MIINMYYLYSLKPYLPSTKDIFTLTNNPFLLTDMVPHSDCF
jgi:hypothetical protein